MLNYDELAGRRELREQIARLMLDGGSVVTADDLVLTSGCHSALSLALLSVCQPGTSSPWNPLLLRHHADAARAGIKDD